MPDRDVEAARALADLPEPTRKMLAGIRPDELETFQTLIEIPPEDALGIIRLYQTTKTVSKFVRWLIVGCVGLFLGVVGLWEGINRFIELIRGAKS